jgi:hypothetical protein
VTPTLFLKQIVLEIEAVFKHNGRYWKSKLFKQKFQNIGLPMVKTTASRKLMEGNILIIHSWHTYNLSADVWSTGYM